MKEFKREILMYECESCHNPTPNIFEIGECKICGKEICKVCECQMNQYNDNPLQVLYGGSFRITDDYDMKEDWSIPKKVSICKECASVLRVNPLIERNYKDHISEVVKRLGVSIAIINKDMLKEIKEKRK